MVCFKQEFFMLLQKPTWLLRLPHLLNWLCRSHAKLEILEATFTQNNRSAAQRALNLKDICHTSHDGVEHTKETNPVRRPSGVGETEINRELHVSKILDQAQLVIEEVFICGSQSKRRCLAGTAVFSCLLFQSLSLVPVVE